MVLGKPVQCTGKAFGDVFRYNSYLSNDKCSHYYRTVKIRKPCTLLSLASLLSPARKEKPTQKLLNAAAKEIGPENPDLQGLELSVQNK